MALRQNGDGFAPERVILGLCRPSRRWRMASLSVIFTAIFAVI
jgi:hypothetical protein